MFSPTRLISRVYTGFYRLVRTEHKARFEKMCQEIIGQSCGHAAKKRSRKEDEEGTLQIQTWRRKGKKR